MRSEAPAAAVLIRLSVGAVFLSEGLQKFMYPESLGAGRFERMGYESAAWIAPMVGGFEVLCGALLLAGLLTRLAAIPIVAIMLTAIATTKIPILLGRDFLGFKVRQLSEYGFWSMAHESRTDFAMLMGALFLLWVGAGPWSADARLLRRSH
ncbi:MAG: DoxX family protein [Candidatus Hydrogenedentes bacterium]|nr:DoxX family protein [Candidatus Hydrogenedentota bacterium]